MYQILTHKNVETSGKKACDSDRMEVPCSVPIQCGTTMNQVGRIRMCLNENNNKAP